MTRAEGRQASTPLHDSLREYGRGIAGGLLFSLPLLYTQELWTAGLSVPPTRQLVLVLSTFLLLLGYNRFAGLHPDTSWSEVVIDSVEELGLGVFMSAGAMYLIGQVSPARGLDENLGLIVIEAMVVAIGVSVGTAQLGGSEQGNEEAPGLEEDADAGRSSFGGRLVIALCGAVLFAANVAPTEEIQIIAATASNGQLLAMAAVSLLLGGGILFYSNFIGTSLEAPRAKWPEAIRGSVITYAVALAASLLFLWYFGRLGAGPPSVDAAQMIVLGLPAVLGASAGRLLLES